MPGRGRGGGNLARHRDVDNAAANRTDLENVAANRNLAFDFAAKDRFNIDRIRCNLAHFYLDFGDLLNDAPSPFHSTVQSLVFKHRNADSLQSRD